MAPDAQATSGDVTGLLKVWSEGDERAFDRLIPLVYAELHRMAHRTNRAVRIGGDEFHGPARRCRLERLVV